MHGDAQHVGQEECTILVDTGNRLLVILALNKDGDLCSLKTTVIDLKLQSKGLQPVHVNAERSIICVFRCPVAHGDCGVVAITTSVAAVVCDV